MSKKCVQLADNQLEKPVQFRPHYPPSPAAKTTHAKVTHNSGQTIPTIHKALSQVLHSHVEENNRGQNGVIPSLHTAYYYYY